MVASGSAVSEALIEITTRQAWDDLLTGRSRAHLLQSWAWGELKGRFGWEPIRLCARDAIGRSVLAQALIRRQLGMSVIYVPRGPVWSGVAQLDHLLLHGLIRLARRRRAAFLRLEPNMLESDPETQTLHTSLLLHGFEPAEPLQPRTTIHLDLRASPDDLLSNMSKGHRADIKRAARKGVKVRAGQGPADLATFYRLMEETAQRAGFAIHSREYYSAAMDLVDKAAPGAARLLLAEREGQTLAAFLIFGWGDEAQYMYSASSQDGLRIGANHLLQWESIQWARQQGCRIYDFWGIPDALGEAALTEDPTERERLEEEGHSHPLAGVYRFKKGFGGYVARYIPAYDYVFIRPAYWIWQRRRGGA
ncbi:MAG: methicillin resistance protein [Herpetosiphonaceae bacterium]|nr:MAG: methicillin resistance protein [Herpetosiphonaceae bacterium]